MPPRTSWRTLLPGLLALATVLAIAASVLMFAGVGKTRGRTARLYALTSQAQGVLNGTEVWFVGQKVGTVERVEFRPPSMDSANRVVLVLEVAAKGIGQIRENSVAQIRTGGNVIGPAVVYITGGTPQARALRDGDTLRASFQVDRADVAARLGEAGKDIGPIIADTRAIMAHLRHRTGAPRAVGRGSLVEQHDGEVARFRGNLDRLRDVASGAALADAGEAMARARVALARADSIRTLLDSPNTSLGRYRRDSTLATTVASLRTELDSVRAALTSVHGNIGRLGRDSAMTAALANAQREMALLFADMKRRPSRYIAF
jgi:ABC-type transporter Mla subunit MlaD